MTVIVPKRNICSRQPAGKCEIDWKNPLTDNLILAYLPGSRINLVNGHQFAVTRGITTNSDGLCTDPSNNGSYIRLPIVVNASSEYAIYDIQSVSVFARMRQTVEINVGWNFVRGNGSQAPTWGVGLWGGSFDGPIAQLGSFYYGPGTSDASMVGNVHTVCIAGDGANLSLYYDKKIITSNSAYTTTVPQYNSLGRQVIVGSDAQNLTGLNTQTSLALLFSGRISSEKYFELERNPWQLFAPRRQWFAMTPEPVTTRVLQLPSFAFYSDTTKNRQLPGYFISAIEALPAYQSKIYRSGVWASVPIKRYDGVQWVSIVARPSV